jgi:hypothetical protein
MPTNGVFAERLVDLVKSSGERIAFRVEFGPILPERLYFSCRVRFHGWIESPPDIRGRDSLDVILLYVGLVHGILDAFVRKGGRVLWPGTDCDYDLVHFVSSPEWHRAKPITSTKRRRPGQRAKVGSH